MGKDLYVCALLDVYGGFLSEKQRMIADHYYNEDLSLAEIAENEGITRQGVGDLIKRAESQLRAWERQYGYCEKFLKLKQSAAAIETGDPAQTAALRDLIESL